MANNTVLEHFYIKAMSNRLTPNEADNLRTTLGLPVPLPVTPPAGTQQEDIANEIFDKLGKGYDDAAFINQYFVTGRLLSFNDVPLAKALMSSDAVKDTTVNPKIRLAVRYILSNLLSSTGYGTFIKKNQRDLAAIINAYPDDTGAVTDKADFNTWLGARIAEAEKDAAIYAAEMAARTAATTPTAGGITGTALHPPVPSTTVLHYIASLCVPTAIFPVHLLPEIAAACGITAAGLTVNGLQSEILAKTGAATITLPAPTLDDEQFITSLLTANPNVLDNMPLDILDKIFSSVSGKKLITAAAASFAARTTPVAGTPEAIGLILKTKQVDILNKLSGMPEFAVIQIQDELKSIIGNASVNPAAKTALNGIVDSKIDVLKSFDNKKLKQLEKILNKIGKIRTGKPYLFQSKPAVNREDNKELVEEVRKFLIILRGGAAVTDADIEEAINAIMLGNHTVNSANGLGMNAGQYDNLNKRKAVEKFQTAGNLSGTKLLHNELGATLACHTIISSIHKAKGRAFKSKIFTKQEEENLAGARRFAANHILVPVLMGAGITALTLFCPPAGVAAAVTLSGINIGSKFMGMKKVAALQGRGISKEEKIAFTVYAGVTAVTAGLSVLGAGALNGLIGAPAAAEIISSPAASIASKAGFFVRSYAAEWINASQMQRGAVNPFAGNKSEKAKFILGRGTAGAVAGVAMSTAGQILGAGIHAGIGKLHGLITGAATVPAVAVTGDPDPESDAPEPGTSNDPKADTPAPETDPNPDPKASAPESGTSNDPKTDPAASPAAPPVDINSPEYQAGLGPDDIDIHGYKASDYNRHGWAPPKTAADKAGGHWVHNPREDSHIIFNGGKNDCGQDIRIDKDVQSDGSLKLHKINLFGDCSRNTPDPDVVDQVQVVERPADPPSTGEIQIEGEGLPVPEAPVINVPVVPGSVPSTARDYTQPGARDANPPGSGVIPDNVQVVERPADPPSTGEIQIEGEGLPVPASDEGIESNDFNFGNTNSGERNLQDGNTSGIVPDSEPVLPSDEVIESNDFNFEETNSLERNLIGENGFIGAGRIA
jgi:hypothetical protein